MPGDMGNSTITYTYDDYGSDYRGDRTSPFAVFLVLGIAIVAILGIGGSIIYNNYFLYEDTNNATILSQELVKHTGAYGSIRYEYKNTIIIGEEYSIIDSADLMAKFRPGEHIVISEKRRKSDNVLMSTNYIKQ